MEPSNEAKHVLTLDCTERPGIVHAISGFLLEHGRNITELKQFGDRQTAHFFMRVDFAGPDSTNLTEEMQAAFAPIATELGLAWRLERLGTKRRVLIMVSKFGHCLNDLIHRSRMGELPIDIVAVVSNHQDHQGLVEWHNIPFFHVAVTRETKPAAEAELLGLMDNFDVELVVLARYMQVLSDEISRKISGRTINIHHSFLPSFKGAKPYHQAYARGVKTVGATAHYVNSELDEGPIISQQTVEVDHSFSPEDLVAAGRDTECKALSNAVKWHCQGRVFLHNDRTIVLR